MSDTTMTAAPSSFRVGAVFGRAFELLFRDFVKFFLLMAIAWSPFLLISLATLGGERGAANGLPPGTIALLPGLAFSPILFVLGQAVIFYGAFQQMVGNSFTVGESLRRGLARFFPLIGLLLCMGFGIMLGFVLLIVPGVMLYVMWSVALPVCVVERQGPFASLGRSRALTKGSRWKIFGILALIGVASQIAQSVLGLALAAIAGITVYVVFTFLWAALAQAFSAIVVAVIYHDLRVAKEGVDVERIVAVFD